MKKTKKNNKGFSLVELIVVVLIMGIIAVALAPQVMKWVGTSRENSDANTAKDIKSSINIALADAQGKGHTVVECTDLEFTEANMTDTNVGTCSAEIREVMGGDYPKKSDKTVYKITITKIADNSYKVEVE